MDPDKAMEGPRMVFYCVRVTIVLIPVVDTGPRPLFCFPLTLVSVPFPLLLLLGQSRLRP